MRKIVAITIAVVMLMAFCACSMTVDTSAALAKQEEELKETPRSEMTVRMSFGEESAPEVELVLDNYFQLVSVQALNEGGSALLEGIRLKDRTHYMVIREILKKAQDADLLKQTSKLILTAKSEVSSIWTFATTDILSIPVEHHMEETGAVFTFRVKLPKEAPAQFNPEGLQVYTAEGEDWAYEYYAQASGIPWKTYWTFPDHEEIQFDFGNSEVDDISLLFYEDGSFEYRRRKPIGTTKNADGFTDYLLMYVTCTESPEGVYIYSYNDGQSDKGRRSDGTVWETIFDSSGMAVKAYYTDTDGISWETFYENGQMVKCAGTSADGSYFEEIYNELGERVSYTRRNAEGDVVEATFENGKEKTERRYTEGSDYELYEVWEWKNETTAIVHSKVIDGDRVEEYDTEVTIE